MSKKKPIKIDDVDVNDNLNNTDFNSFEEFLLFVETIQSQVKTFYDTTQQRIVKSHALDLKIKLDTAVSKLKRIEKKIW